MRIYKNNKHKKPRIRYYILFFIFINLAGTKASLFATSKPSHNDPQEQNFELKIHRQKNEEINFSSFNNGFLSPLKYQIKNEIPYKMPADPINKSFMVRLYNDINPPLPSSLPNFMNAPSDESLITFNLFNTFKIKILPHVDWRSFLFNPNFSTRNDTIPKAGQFTVLDIGVL